MAAKPSMAAKAQEHPQTTTSGKEGAMADQDGGKNSYQVSGQEQEDQQVTSEHNKSASKHKWRQHSSKSGRE